MPGAQKLRAGLFFKYPTNGMFLIAIMQFPFFLSQPILLHCQPRYKDQ